MTRRAIIARVETAGRDAAWSAPMTDLQRERAEAPFAVESGESWWQSLLLWLAIAGVMIAVMAVLS